MTMPSLKVLQVLGMLSMGGAETWLMEVLRFWSKNKIGQMDFLLTSGKRGLFDDEAERLGAKLHYVQYGRANLPGFVKQFRSILKQEGYDAIHHHGDYVSGQYFLWGLGCLPPVRVSHVHNPWAHIETNYTTSPSRQFLVKAGKHLVQNLATHVCGTSADILQKYGFPLQSDKRPITMVLHCGFEVGRFNQPLEPDRVSVLREFGWSESAKVILFAGRLDRALEYEHPQNHKNSWLALNAVKAAIERDASIRFLMAGDGVPQRLKLQQHIESWGLAEHVRLLGVRTDMPRLMRAADMLFFPSRQEGLGMVAVEAQASGLPVLASDAVPVAAKIIPGIWRSLPVKAPLEAWTEAVVATLKTPRVALDEARQAVEASDFSITTSADRLARVYSGG